MMKPQLRAILEENMCDLAIEPPPKDFVQTTNPIAPDEDFSTFNTQKIYDLAGPSLEQATVDKYLHMRQYYMNQLRSQSRNQLIEDQMSKIQAILKSGSPAEIQKLFRERHQWREHAQQYKSGTPICKIPECPHLVVCGSEYCMNHILNDKNQKLFVECPDCHRPYPVTSSCFFCSQ